MKQALNYAHLAKKYLGAKVTVHNRTYEGLEWHGPGEKPTHEIFEAFQREEDREARVAGRKFEPRPGLVEEKQRQAKQKAMEAIRPLEEKLREKEQATFDETYALKSQALEIQSRLREREMVIDCWKEISATQAIAQEEAQKYIEDTMHLVSPDNPSPVSKEVLEKRRQAFKILEEGKLVFADFSKLRAQELPSREEMAEAIRKGGDHLKRLEEICKSATLKYPRPRRNHF